MIKQRDEIYKPGLPARPGEHYRALVRFAAKHAGPVVLDLGCGYGAYSAALMEQGFRCFGADINFDYLRQAKSQGLVAIAVDSILPLASRSVDTVLLLEVIEHVAQIENVMREAFRVARKNVLVTVPNSEDIELMKSNDVTYAHMLSSDHLHFFDPASLKVLLSQFSSEVSIERSDPIYPYWFLGRSAPFYALRAMFRLGLLKPRFHSRLYAVARVRQN